MKKIIDYLKKNHLSAYFISPHFDDAIFSAGATICELVNSGISVTIVNIFTKANGPSTLSGLAFLKKCNYNSPEELYKDRENEDMNVVSMVSKNKVINLGFEDALWRKSEKRGLIPEFNHVYPTFRLHIAKGIISPVDSRLIEDITNRLETIIPKNSVVFGPLGVGKHVDHVIVNKVLTSLRFKKIFWLDFPYSQYSESTNVGLPYFSFLKNKIRKKELVLGYKSQVKAIFGKNIQLADEKFYSAIPEINHSVSVCIPAHNEEESIGQLLDSISDQMEQYYKIVEIVIYCDGCTDKTLDIVKSKAKTNKKIKIINSHKRTGLSVGQNTLLHKSLGDIVVLLNSDIKITDNLFVEKMAKRIVSGSHLVSVKLTPLSPKSFFEKVLHKGTIFKEKVFEEYNEGKNLYTCHGPARAFSRKLANKIAFKFDTGEDAYSYLYALKNNFSYSFAPEAEVFYRLPNTYTDYLNQTKRFSKSSLLNTKEFGDKFFRDNSKIGFCNFIKTAISHPFLTIENFIYLALYSTFLFFTKISMHHTPENKWKPAISTKKL